MRKRTMYVALDSDQTGSYEYARVFGRKPKVEKDTDIFGDPQTRFQAKDNDKLVASDVDLCVAGLRAAGINLQAGQVVKLTIIPEVLK